MPPPEILDYSGSLPPVQGASTLRDQNRVYEMTRAHIAKGLPLGILIDQEGMTLKPTGETVKSGNDELHWYALRDGSINPHISVRSKALLPEHPEKGTVLLGVPETDEHFYSGFTVVEVFSK